MRARSHADPVSAKRLGVSARTYAGYVADLKEEYDADTRFQLGYTMGTLGISGNEHHETAPDDLRLFPIVGGDLCYPVAALLSRGELEEAAELVSDRCWVASTPLYG